jgi:hypothetical protein
MAVAMAAFVLNTAVVVDPGLHDTHIYPRYWQDLHIATGLFRTGLFPAWVAAKGAPPNSFSAADPEVKRPTRRADIEPWQAWWTLPPDALDDFTEPRLVRRFDDSGRPLIMGLAFHVLGGVAPLLLFWMSGLHALPVLLWTALELIHEERAVAALLFPILVGSSPFVAEALALTYSASGFYVVAALILVAVAAAAFGTRRLSMRGLLLRAAGAGIVFGLCTLGRGGCLLLIPGFVLAFVAAARRAVAGEEAGLPGRRILLGLLSLGLFALPLVAARWMVDARVRHTFQTFGEGQPEPQKHAFWWGVWTGLGDFDRVKGYRWRDASAAAAVAAAGGPQITGYYYDPRSETILRDAVTRDIRDDPLWYAGILARRVLATVSLRKLWPWAPTSGRSIAARTSWNEGVIDNYYALVTPMDWTGAGRVRWEWPVPLMLAPTLGLVAAAVLAGGRLTELRRDAALLATVGAATLILPVAISTASGLEPQVFALTYLLGAALAADRAATIIHRWALQRRRS